MIDSDSKRKLNKSKWRKTLLKSLLYLFLVLLVLFFTLVLVIRLPSTQQRITQKFTTYVTEKTGTHISIDRFYITFSGNLWLEGLYVEDEMRDTLLHSRSLEMGISFRPLFQKKVHINSFDWEGLVVNIKKYPDGNYNFQFLINAFMGSEVDIDIETDKDFKPWQFIFPTLSLNDFRFSYVDQVDQLSVTGNLDQMALNFQPINTWQFQIHFNSIYIHGLALDVCKGDAENELGANERQQNLTTPGDALAVTIERLNLESIQVKFSDENSSSFIKLKLKEHQSRDIQFLPPQDENTFFTLKCSSMQTSELDFHREVSDDVTLKQQGEDIHLQESEFFTWPDLVLDLNNISFYDQRYRLRDEVGKPTPGVINFSDLDVNIDTLIIPFISLKDKKLLMDVASLSLRDHSGAKINRSKFSLLVDNQNFRLNSLNFKSGSTHISGDILATYENLTQAILEPASVQFSLDLPQIYLLPLDLLYFIPELKKDTFLSPFYQMPLQLALKIKGGYDDLSVQQFKGIWNHTDLFDIQGKVTSFLDPARMNYHFDRVNLVVLGETMKMFISPDTTYTLPEVAKINGRIHGNLKDAVMNIILNIPEGHFELEGEFRDMREHPSYNGIIHIDQWNATRYLDSIAPEMVTGEIFFSGNGVDLHDLHLDVDIEFKEMLYKGRSLTPLYVSTQIRGNRADYNVNIESDLAKFQLFGKGRYDTSGYYTLTGKLDATHLDLKGLYITEEEMAMSGKLEFNISGVNNISEGSVHLIGINVIKDSKLYNLENIQSQFAFHRDSAYMDFSSKLATGHFKSTSAIDQTVNTMMSYVKSYFYTEAQDSLITGDLIAELKIFIPETDFLKEVLFPGLESMDDAHLTMYFEQNSNKMELDLILPQALYKGTEVSGIFTKFYSNDDSLYFDAGFDNVNSGFVNINSTHLSGHFSDNVFRGLIQVSDSEEGHIVDVEYSLQYAQDTIYMSLNPEKIIFQNDLWIASPNNRIVFAKDYLDISHFELSHGSNLFTLEGHPSGKNDFLRLDFNGISLEDLLSVIHSETTFGRGNIQGYAELDHIFDHFKMKADIDISDLHFMDEYLGHLKTEITNTDTEHFKMDLTVSGGSLLITSTGTYQTFDAGDAHFQGEINLSNFEFNMLEKFTDGELRSGKGLIHGNIKLDNTAGEPNYDGYLHFDRVGFTLSQSGTSYSIPSEYIRFSQSNIQLENFVINDSDGNPTIITGEIGIESIINPEFNLTVKSQNFKLLESTKEDNDLVFGKAILDFDVQVTGYAKRPRIKANVKLKKGSDITLVLPEYESEVRDRAGVVVIERRVDGKVISEEESDESLTLFIGVDVQSIIKIEPEALFRIIIDERAGDQIEVAGEANLSFDSDATGNMSLSGLYELNKGFYEMRLYDIISRRFVLKQGSKLVWSGDILDAEMEVKATYRVRTSALDLMADQLAGADESLRTQYRQELPFDVILHMKGDMLHPQIAFELDMPENARIEFGGNVYNRIKQLNTMESELNTQVFSLMVFGRFLPPGMASEETRGLNMSGMMRSSASRMLSGQLNALSDKYINAVDLDFDLESFTDFQTGVPQDRTQLNLRLRRSLINERLTVQLGGQIDIEGSNETERQNATNMLGDVSVEWRLSEDKSWGIRGFRRNQFESLVEGQVIATGISLLFSRNFNSLAELFTRRKDPTDHDSKSKKQVEK